MALNLLDEDDRLRELPCLIIALMIHGALLTTPIVRWGNPSAKTPAAVAVDFVAAVPAPAPPPPQAKPAAPAVGPVPAAERAGEPHRGPGPFRSALEPKPRRAAARAAQKGAKAPPKLKRAPLVSPRAPSPEALQAAAQRKARLAAIQAENARVREQKLQAARSAALALAETKAAEARERRAALERAAASARERELQQARARAQRRADASRQLAAMTDPDEPLSDAIADRPSQGPAAGSPRGRGAEQALLPSATKLAREPRDGDEPLYELDAEGRGGKTRAASGGGAGRDGGGLSWSLDGPAGSRRLLQRVLPASPAWLSERGLELSVQVKFQVRPDGAVQPGAVIKKTSGFPEVDRRALDAIRHWRFAPAAGRGPEAWGVVTFRFLMS